MRSPLFYPVVGISNIASFLHAISYHNLSNHGDHDLPFVSVPELPKSRPSEMCIRDIYI